MPRGKKNKNGDGNGSAGFVGGRANKTKKLNNAKRNNNIPKDINTQRQMAVLSYPKGTTVPNLIEDATNYPQIPREGLSAGRPGKPYGGPTGPKRQSWEY